MPTTKKEQLIEIFTIAKNNHFPLVVLRVKMPEHPGLETIINPWKNIDKKIDYIKGAYDDNLNHKNGSGVKIVDFSYVRNIELLPTIFYEEE